MGRSRISDVVRAEYRGNVPDLGRLCRQDPEGHQARRPPCTAADKVRASRQSEDSQGARADDPALDPRPRRRGHRVRLLIVVLVTILTAGATAGGVAGQRVPRVGVLVPGSPEREQGLEDFREGMRSLGWTDQSNVSIEARFANGDPALLSANAAEFAAAKVDVIVAFATLATQAAHQATSTIPIVTSAGDPYYGLVQPQRYLRGGSAAGWHPHGRVPSAPRTIKFGPPMLRMALPALS